MNAACVVRAGAPGSVTVGLHAAAPPAPPAAGMVCLAVEESVLDARVLVMPASGPTAVPWCSLVGHVTQVGEGSSPMEIGQRVGTIGPAARMVAVPAATCHVVPSDLTPGVAAHWALLLALVRAFDGVEVGAAAIVLGGGLVGQLIAQVARVAGAAWVVGVDADAVPSRAGAVWATDLDAARRMLPPGGADLLVDTLGDGARLARALATVRTGGRVLLMAARRPDVADLDLYPDVHRRSLTVTGIPLCAAGHIDARLAAYARWLVEQRRLAVPAQQAIVSDGPAAERTVSPSGVASVIVRWSGAAG